MQRDRVETRGLARRIFEGQWRHGIGLVLLVWSFAWVSRSEAFRVGEYGGWSTLTWAWTSVGVAVTHQLVVWLFWRLELHAGWISGLLGPWGFRLHMVIFMILFLGRAVTVACLAVANAGTVDLPEAWLRAAALVLLVPNLYLGYSVMRYFGLRRAIGEDHFDPSYRSKPLVRNGIFRFTGNGMYFAGFLLLWVVALWTGSVAALWVALFQHLYIWVHFFATERPDMQRIYG